MSRVVDDTQKLVRYMEIEVVGITYDHDNNVSTVTYRYVGNPNKSDTWENRSAGLSEYLPDNLNELKPGKCYLVECVNVKTEAVTKWVWFKIDQVPEQVAIDVCRIREKFKRTIGSRNQPLSPDVIKAVTNLGIDGWYSYLIAKGEWGGAEPSYIEILVAGAQAENRVSEKAKRLAKKLIVQWWNTQQQTTIDKLFE